MVVIPVKKRHLGKFKMDTLADLVASIRSLTAGVAHQGGVEVAQVMGVVATEEGALFESEEEKALLLARREYKVVSSLTISTLKRRPYNACFL